MTGVILVRDVMEIWLPLPEEQEPGMVVGERIRLVKTIRFFGHHFPEVQVLFSNANLIDRYVVGELLDGKAGCWRRCKQVDAERFAGGKFF